MASFSKTLTSALLLSCLTLSLASCSKSDSDTTSSDRANSDTTSSARANSDTTSSARANSDTASSSSANSDTASSSSANSDTASSSSSNSDTASSSSANSGTGSSNSGTYSPEVEEAIEAIAEKYQNDLMIVAEYSEKDTSTFTEQEWAIFNDSKDVVDNMSSEVSATVEKFNINLDENFELWAMRLLIPQMGAEGLAEEFLHAALTGRFSASAEAKMYSLLRAYEYFDENSEAILEALNIAGNVAISAGNSVIDYFTDREKIVLSDNEEIATFQKYMYNMKTELYKHYDVTEFFSLDYTTLTKEEWGYYGYGGGGSIPNYSVVYLSTLHQRYAAVQGVPAVYQERYDEIFELIYSPTIKLSENVNLTYKEYHGTITETEADRLANRRKYQDTHIQQVQEGNRLLKELLEELGIYDHTYLG